MFWTLPLFFVAGLVWWSLLEYLLHRHVLHRFPASLGKRHMQHHAMPNVRRLAVAPLPNALGGGAFFGLLFVLLLGPARGLAALAGLLVGYVAYEALHYASHYLPSRRPWRHALRRHHMLHHHAEPHARYGVSTLIWDHAFKTLPSKVGSA